MTLRYRLLSGPLAMGALAVALALIVSGERDSLAVGPVIYVDADATAGNNDGTSWEDAFTDLQPALNAVEGEIWVAAGTYRPAVEHGGIGARYRSFQLKNGLALYGGFDPSVGAIEFGDRDWEANPTILSGDLNGDDVPPFANNEENSYHVFYHPSGTHLGVTAILDGFVITGGNANSSASPHNEGGGMYNYGSSPALTNCTFVGNSAVAGGGMVNHGASSPALSNCTFAGNTAVASGGGGMVNGYSSPSLVNCTFVDNSAVGGGGGILNYSTSLTLTNCTFSGNSANSGGGMRNWSGSSLALTNSILWGDTPNEIHNDPSSSSVVTYSDIQGGHDGEGNIDADPLFLDAGNGDVHLSLGSPCLDVGNDDAPDLPAYDFEGDGRILDGDGNFRARVDMGADELAFDWPYFPVHLPVVFR